VREVCFRITHIGPEEYSCTFDAFNVDARGETPLLALLEARWLTRDHIDQLFRVARADWEYENKQEKVDAVN